jgi:hypothetical protein
LVFIIFVSWDIHNLSFLVGKEGTLHSEHLPPSW